MPESPQTPVEPDARAEIVRRLVAIEAEEGARLPGSRRLALRQKAETEGITVPASLLEQIRKLDQFPMG